MERDAALHEKAMSCRLAEELCLDLARKHAGCVEWSECEACKRLTEQLRYAWGDDPATNDADKRVQRCNACERKFQMQFHYQQIASLLYCRRPTPYAEKRNASLNCPTRAERLLCRDLASVVNDPSYTMQRRQTALRELEELTEEIDNRSNRLDRESFAATEALGSFESRAERILKKVREFQGIHSNKLFQKAIVRYLTAKVRNATWAASLPLLEYLALEWLRDRRSLWRFLDAAFARWKEFTNPRSVPHKSVLIHQLHGSESFRAECQRRKTTVMGEVFDVLIGQDAATLDEADNVHGALRTQKSRELSKSQAKQPAIPVTIR